LKFLPLPDLYAIARLAPRDPLPAWAAGAFVSMTRTSDELSVVCLDSAVPAGIRADRGWRCVRAEGPLPLTAVGVAAEFTAVLARAGISALIVGTFDTDYILVKADRFEEAMVALGG